jgi:hypothetical protein
LIEIQLQYNLVTNGVGKEGGEGKRGRGQKRKRENQKETGHGSEIVIGKITIQFPTNKDTRVIFPKWMHITRISSQA